MIVDHRHRPSLPAFGQNSMDVGVEFAKGLSQCALALFPVIWIAFAALPGGVFPGLPNAPRVEGTPADRAILALRPVLVLLPLFVYMLSSDNNIRYLIGYYQPAMIAQHARRATARQADRRPAHRHAHRRHGGLIMWWIVKLWPSWFWFVLMMALFSLFYRDAHLRQRTRRAVAELLPLELRPDDAGLHRLPRRPDPGFQRRRCEHEVLPTHRRLRSRHVVFGLRRPALRRGRRTPARVAQAIHA